MKNQPPKIDMEKLEQITERYRARYVELLEDGHFADLEDELEILMQSGSSNEVLFVGLHIELSHDSRGCALQLKGSRLHFTKDEGILISHAKAILARYLVHGRIVSATNMVCPNCWSIWVNKSPENGCPECDFHLGEDIKFLVDDDICPACNTGHVSQSNPQCDKCEEIIDDRVVCWG